MGDWQEKQGGCSASEYKDIDSIVLNSEEIGKIFAYRGPIRGKISLSSIDDQHICFLALYKKQEDREFGRSLSN